MAERDINIVYWFKFLKVKKIVTFSYCFIVTLYIYSL